MDISWLPYPSKDILRDIEVRCHNGATIYDVANGVSLDYIDLTPYVISGTQTTQEVSVTVSWQHELDGTAQPRVGQMLEIRLKNRMLWVGPVVAINDFNLSSGTRKLTVVSRPLDASPKWREVKRVTPVYSIMTMYSYICEQVGDALGLPEAGMDFKNVVGYTARSSTQLAEMSAWQMLTLIMQTSMQEPYFDRYGVLRTISRDTSRPADIVIDNDGLLNVSWSKSRASITEYMVKWLDPNTTEVSQEGRKLGGATITAGFFQLKQDQDVYFSDDRTQRAKKTYMVVKQSANSGLLKVCDEKYKQKDYLHGKITLITSAWVPALATASIAAMIFAAKIPDKVIVFGVGASAGITIPVGRIIHAAAEAVIMLTMMSVGTGMYEIWGTPFDYVHARNRTSAYNQNAESWEENITSVDNDFITDEQTAHSVAVVELVYAYRASSYSYNIDIVDDPRIDKGDILQLNDGSRVYITDFSRDLTPGSPAILKVTGFRC